MDKPKFVYVTYIRATPEKVWEAITKPEFTRQYWGAMANVSDWKAGSRWEHIAVHSNNEVWVEGKVLESTPPKRLVLTWVDPDDKADESHLTIELEPVKELVKLTVVHGDFVPGKPMAEKVSQGWPLVLSSLKSFLENGEPIDILALKKCG